MEKYRLNFTADEINERLKTEVYTLNIPETTGSLSEGVYAELLDVYKRDKVVHLTGKVDAIATCTKQDDTLILTAHLANARAIEVYNVRISKDRTYEYIQELSPVNYVTLHDIEVGTILDDSTIKLLYDIVLQSGGYAVVGLTVPGIPHKVVSNATINYAGPDNLPQYGAFTITLKNTRSHFIYTQIVINTKTVQAIIEFDTHDVYNIDLPDYVIQLEIDGRALKYIISTGTLITVNNMPATVATFGGGDHVGYNITVSSIRPDNFTIIKRVISLNPDFEDTNVAYVKPIEKFSLGPHYPLPRPIKPDTFDEDAVIYVLENSTSRNISIEGEICTLQKSQVTQSLITLEASRLLYYINPNGEIINYATRNYNIQFNRDTKVPTFSYVDNAFGVFLDFSRANMTGYTFDAKTWEFIKQNALSEQLIVDFKGAKYVISKKNQTGSDRYNFTAIRTSDHFSDITFTINAGRVESLPEEHTQLQFRGGYGIGFRFTDLTLGQPVDENTLSECSWMSKKIELNDVLKATQLTLPSGIITKIARVTSDNVMNNSNYDIFTTCGKTIKIRSGAYYGIYDDVYSSPILGILPTTLESEIALNLLYKAIICYFENKPFNFQITGTNYTTMIYYYKNNAAIGSLTYPAANQHGAIEMKISGYSYDGTKKIKLRTSGQRLAELEITDI